MSLAERLARALTEAPASPPELLTGDMADTADGVVVPGAPAAVLVAITDRPEPGLILTLRTDTLRQHAGQVAFPGGRIDPDDTDAVAAALREAREEIGLDPARVVVVGTADPYRTITGFDVMPVVGVIPPDLAFTPAEHEVAEVFEAPLRFVLDPANQRRASQEWRGVMRHYIQIDWQGRRIWGATAAMIVNLSRRLRWT